MTSKDDISCVMLPAGNEDIIECPCPVTDSTKQRRTPTKLKQSKLSFGLGPSPSATPKSAPKPGAGGNSDSEELMTLSMDDDDGDGDYKPTPKKRKSLATQPAVKKSTGKSPVAGTSKPTPVRKRQTKTKSKVSEFTTGLKALSVVQLVDLIEQVVEKHPEIKIDFIGLTPLPDLTPLEKNLETLKKAIYKAFPWTKFGSDRDAFCFRRVKTHLDVFQKMCLEQCKTLIDLQQWKSSIEYVIIAWKYVNELPNWDDPKNDKHKEQCYKKLSSNLTNALKQGNFEKEELKGYIDRLEKLTEDGLKDNGMVQCINLADSILNKL